ncbi:hypothetical protein JHK87_005291 [Glycine soja]|nr:hypothetical protein JHK87_005291 [Glycine soja]
MKEEEVNHCQIQEWYPMFKSVSIKTLIHQLPESFIQHLLDDSGPFLLPVSVLNEDALPNRIHNPDEEEDFQVSEGSDHIHSEGNDVEFRIVEDRCAVRPGLKTAVPFDYLDTSPGSGSISKKMQMKS